MLSGGWVRGEHDFKTSGFQQGDVIRKDAEKKKSQCYKNRIDFDYSCVVGRLGWVETHEGLGGIEANGIAVMEKELNEWKNSTHWLHQGEWSLEEHGYFFLKPRENERGQNQGGVLQGRFALGLTSSRKIGREDISLGKILLSQAQILVEEEGDSLREVYWNGGQ